MTERDEFNPLEALRNAEVPPLSEEVENARRRRIVGSIEALRVSLSEEPTREHGRGKKSDSRQAVVWLKRAAAVVLPVAAAVALWLQWDTRQPSPLVVVASGEVVVESSDGSSRLTRDQQWQSGDEVSLVTGGSEVNLVLPSKTSLHLANQTRATVARVAVPSKRADDSHPAQERVAGEGIRVARGSVQLSASEPEERSLVVVTEQAEVVMRGTLFAVLVTASPTDARTKVSVQAGEATVLSGGREYRLTAGQAWTSSSERADVAATGDGVAVDAGTNATRTAEGANKAAAAKGPSSDLAQQNRLFEAAQAARRSGQTSLALRRFSELIAKFPRSEQAHNARVEHFRLLRSLGRRDEARRSAQAYLNRYPRGFAAAEARELTR